MKARTHQAGWLHALYIPVPNSHIVSRGHFKPPTRPVLSRVSKMEIHIRIYVWIYICIHIDIWIWMWIYVDICIYGYINRSLLPIYGCIDMIYGDAYRCVCFSACNSAMRPGMSTYPLRESNPCLRHEKTMS